MMHDGNVKEIKSVREGRIFFNRIEKRDDMLVYGNDRLKGGNKTVWS